MREVIAEVGSRALIYCTEIWQINCAIMRIEVERQLEDPQHRRTDRDISVVVEVSVEAADDGWAVAFKQDQLTRRKR